ncbi:potassium channel family protein [Candidatus Oscillochloris fontis]|uniref:potassium channel family protein n=1 Tax=Candidatus Oscillochloris fontis TaxID=2496868 RepID=UPI00101CEE37|nr:TrkA family potassium uptake protein [Candidatus Oscillochloris fontis]
MARKAGKPEFAVIGLGRFGSSVALSLINRGYIVLGIDRDPEIVQRLSDRMTQIISMDTTSEEALRAVDIRSFDTVVVAIGAHFENNLLTTVALKSLGVRRVVCKALNERQQHILLKVGADQVVLPEHEAGMRLAVRLADPLVLDHLDLGPGFSVAEVRVPRRFVGQSLAKSDLRRLYGINVLAVRRGQHLIVTPPADLIFNAEDQMLVIGSDDSIHTFCGQA